MNMPARRLRDVAEVIMGTSPKGETYNSVGEGVPLLNGPTEFGERHPRCSLFTTKSAKESEVGDLIFCVRGSTTGRMNWADRPYSLGRGVCAIRGSNDLDTKFIKYCLDHRLVALLQLAGGSTFPNLTQDAIKDFYIPFPPSRHRIAAILSTYDDLIENNRRRMALLEESARQLYKEWFVRLRFPGHEHTRIVDGVPEGWERRELGDCFTLKRGHDLPESQRLPGAIPVVSSSGITGYHSAKKATGPGVVTGRYGTLGEVYYVDEDYWPHNTALYVSDFKEAIPRVVFFVLKNALQKAQSNNAAVPGLNRNVIHTFEVLWPPVQIHRHFDDFLQPLFAQLSILRAANEKLRAARDLLLPRLMSGTIQT